MLGQQARETFARAGRPGDDENAALADLKGADVIDDGVEDIDVRVLAFECEAFTLLGVHRSHVRAFGLLERGEAHNLVAAERLPPRFGVEEHLVRRHGLIGFGAEILGFKALDAGVVMLANLLEARFDHVFGVVVERHLRTVDIVE